jgi:LysM repeat protein
VPLSVRELRKAQSQLDVGNREEGRAILEAMLVRYPDDDGSDEARQLLTELNIEQFLSRQPSARQIEYVVESGDALSSIARRLDSTPRIIMQWNDLDSTVIHPGDKLIVPKLDFRVRVNLPRERVVVEDERGFFAQFPINHSTVPKGPGTTETKVAGKIFWRKGIALPPTAVETADADIWIKLRLPGYALYNPTKPRPGSIVERNAGTATKSGRLKQPARGIALEKDDMQTLQALVRRGTPVTIFR